jgi:tetratricopeptide (TPR) repeat protein
MVSRTPAYAPYEKEKLQRLAEFLRTHYPYCIESPQAAAEQWELNGKTDRLAVTGDNLMYWALDMAKRGYEFDAEFDSYGAPFDPKTQEFPELSVPREDYWFALGVSQYGTGNLSGALIGWSHAISINPRNADAFYSRAIIKSELYTWKAALRDYDAALEIAPHFLSALLNRGSLKDDNGDHRGAIDDYDQVIASASQDDSNLAMAYFNRGNSKHSLGDNTGACADWGRALELGAGYARDRIAEYCGS